MFPEERDGETDDYEKGIEGLDYDANPIYKNNNSNNKYSVNNSVGSTKDYTTNSNGIRITNVGVAGDIIVIGDNLYYRHSDGTFHKGWLGLSNGWYYFDPNNSVLVRNELKEIDGVVYYFDNYGIMLFNTIIEIAGYKIKIDENGYCTLIN